MKMVIFNSYVNVNTRGYLDVYVYNMYILDIATPVSEVRNILGLMQDCPVLLSLGHTLVPSGNCLQ